MMAKIFLGSRDFPSMEITPTPLSNNPYDFEIHVTHAGEILLVAAVNDLTLKELQRPLDDMREFALYSSPYRTTDLLVAIAITQLRYLRARPTEGAQIFDFEPNAKASTSPPPEPPPGPRHLRPRQAG